MRLNMTRVQLYRLHKWFAIAAGIFFLSWIVSGMVMIWPRGAAAQPKPVRPDFESAIVSPARAASGIEETVKGMSLVRIGDRLVYQIQTGRGIRLVDAHSGESFRITPEIAERAVRSEYPIDAQVTTQRLDRYDRMYRWGPLPVYRIDAVSDVHYYVSTQDGTVRRVTRTGGIREAIESMHTFDVVPGISSQPRLRKVALFGAGLIALGAALSGYLIALPRRRGLRG